MLGLRTKIGFEWRIGFNKEGGPIVTYVLFASKLRNPMTISSLFAGSPFRYGSLLGIGLVSMDCIQGIEWTFPSRNGGSYWRK
jgi:hypothetical protein